VYFSPAILVSLLFQTPLIQEFQAMGKGWVAAQDITGRCEMELWASELCRYHASCTKFNNKFNHLQRLHKITEFYIKWFSVGPNITWICRTITIFQGFAKDNNNSSKTCRCVHDPLPCRLHLSKCNGSRLSSKNKIWILTFNPPPCSYFWFVTKTFLLNVVHPLMSIGI
jgi:hypothetical protein